MKPAEQTVNNNKLDQMVVTCRSRGSDGSSTEYSTRDQPSRKTTKGKATKSTGRRCSEMVQGDGDPEDRCQKKKLGEGHYIYTYSSSSFSV